MDKVFEVALDIEPVTYGEKEKTRRKVLRDAVKTKFPNFSKQFIKQIVEEHQEIKVELNCYLINPQDKDIDNLAKIPIDAIFFSAQGEDGYKNWGSKINSLTINKIKSASNALEIKIYV